MAQPLQESDLQPRMGPRPLPLHMAVEGWIMQLSCAALMTSRVVLPRSSPNAPLLPALPDLLPRALAESQSAQVDPSKLDPIQLISAVAAAAKTRMETFAAGVGRYQAAPPAERPSLPPPIWAEGVAALRAYGGEGAPIVVVPSLINRATVLDLSADRSFLRDLAAAGFATYLLDWGCPGVAERAFTLETYVMRVLIPALRHVTQRHKRPPHLIGYCMGGTMAVAPAVLAPNLVASVSLLAAPWDFHADTDGPRSLLTLMRPILETIIGAHGVAPVDLLQALFAALDPSLVGRKFRAYAKLPQASDEARRFVALEDWLNDGIPLAGPAARECLFEWYGENTPLRRSWRIAGTAIDPARVGVPALAMVPSQDRIVPPASALALGAALPRATIQRVALGHIGMMAGGSAREMVTKPLIGWLNATDQAAKA